MSNLLILEDKVKAIGPVSELKVNNKVNYRIVDTIKNEGFQIVELENLVYEENYKINHEGRQVLNK